MIKKINTKKVRDLGEFLLKGIGLCAVSLMLYEGAVNVYNDINKTNTELYTDQIQVKAGRGKNDHRIVIIKPAYVSWEKTNYSIGAVDLNNDGVFQEDELFDTRYNALPDGLDSLFYAKYFDYFYTPEKLDGLYKSVAPNRCKTYISPL